jgi:hypothetical protein
MKKYRINFQNYVSKRESIRETEAEDLDDATNIARVIRSQYRYLIIRNIEEITENDCRQEL